MIRQVRGRLCSGGQIKGNGPAAQRSDHRLPSGKRTDPIRGENKNNTLDHGIVYRLFIVNPPTALSTHGKLAEPNLHQEHPKPDGSHRGLYLPFKKGHYET